MIQYEIDSIRNKRKPIVGHRQPTSAEINFGNGAIHYKDFPRELWTKSDGTLKKRLKCRIDGLFYSR